jgi:hypothetical protein
MNSHSVPAQEAGIVSGRPLLGARKPSSDGSMAIRQDERDKLGVRALASSILGLLVLGLLAGATTKGGTLWGVFVVVFGSIVGLPFAIGVAAIAYWFAPHILRRPILWSIGVWALVNAAWAAFFAQDMASHVLAASTAAVVIFYAWGLKPFR